MNSQGTPGQDRNSIAARAEETRQLNEMLAEAYRIDAEENGRPIPTGPSFSEMMRTQQGRDELWHRLTKDMSDHEINGYLLNGALLEGAILRKRAERRAAARRN